jgi:hypothetical protein
MGLIAIVFSFVSRYALNFLKREHLWLLPLAILRDQVLDNEDCFLLCRNFPSMVGDNQGHSRNWL